jgi:hypothetical protein
MEEQEALRGLKDIGCEMLVVVTGGYWGRAAMHC